MAKAFNKENDPLKSDKHIIDGYIEKQSIQAAGHLVVLAENSEASEPYLVCFCKWDNPLGINEYYNAYVTEDYTEALSFYAKGILKFTNELEKEMADYEKPPRVLTAKDCVPNGLEQNLTDKLLIVKPESLAPEYRRIERQLRLCTGGFGASPTSRGNAVFCKDLLSGKDSRFERYDILGVADIKKLPAWVSDKLKLLKTKQPPSLLSQVREAAKVAEQQKSERGNKPKKHEKIEI